MDRGYDSEPLKVAEESQGLSQRIMSVHKQLDALSHEFGVLEERITPIMRPEGTRINVGSIEADRLGDRNISPLSGELEELNSRASQLRQRVRDAADRVEL